MKSAIAVALLAVLTGCATQASVSDVAQDHVRVQALGDDVGPVNEQGFRACNMFGRRAVAMSTRCLDAYCLQKEYLFACVP